MSMIVNLIEFIFYLFVYLFNYSFSLVFLVVYLYTPISIQVASEKNNAWSMFHSPRCIIVASPVNYVPTTNLET